MEFQRFSQSELPLETVVNARELLIIEKSLDDKVIEREIGFFYDVIGGHVILLKFDPQFGLRTSYSGGVIEEDKLNLKEYPKLADVAFYYRLPAITEFNVSDTIVQESE